MTSPRPVQPTWPGERVGLPAPRPPDWTRLAACRDRWTDLDWTDPSPEQALQCRAICSDCPVRRQCLAAALITAEPWGIWGGLDADERADLAAASGLPIPTVLPAHGIHARYIRHGCRCRACRHAHAVYERRRRDGLETTDRARRSAFIRTPASVCPQPQEEGRKPCSTAP